MAEKKKSSTAKKVAKGAALAGGTAAGAYGMVRAIEKLYESDVPGARGPKYPGSGLTMGAAGTVAKMAMEKDRLHEQRKKSPVKRPKTRT